MEVHLRPEIESRLQELAAKTGRAPNDLIEDAMAGYLQELAQTREMLDSRYDDLKSGQVKRLTAKRPSPTSDERAKSVALVHERICPRLRFWEGHDFSRADKSLKMFAASAAEARSCSPEPPLGNVERCISTEGLRSKVASHRFGTPKVRPEQVQAGI
jgi:predicted DNA-binding protein